MDESPEICETNLRHAAETVGLHRRFGRREVLRDVSLQLPTGTVTGLVGVNGSGKTTLIKHLIGSLRAQSGSVTVLGRDPTVRPELTLAKIGYMSEEDTLPTWMSVGGLMRYSRQVYPHWDQDYAMHLCRQFEIDATVDLAAMSKGQRARVALMLATSHRPELLILDEPSSGLDPIARRDILEMVVSSLSELGTTVLFSSHLLDEVARVCDRIVVMSEGHLRPPVQWTDLQRNYRVVVASAAERPSIGEAIGVRGGPREWSVIVPTDWSPPSSVQIIETRPLTLDEYFAATARSPGLASTSPASGKVA